MRTTIAATFPLFSLALGAVNWSAIESCVTQSGPAAVKTVSTSSSTTTVQRPDVVVHHTFHPQFLATPRPFTRTWTHTFFQTNTAISTVTINHTRTEYIPTSTVVSTYTQTLVSNVYTTIPTPAGFVPIAGTTTTGNQPPSSSSVSASSAAPSSAAPSSAAPSSIDPSSTDPSSTDPSSAAPSSTDPSSTDPSSTDPSSTDPSSAESSSAAPSSTDPSSAEPSSAESSSVDSSSAAATPSPSNTAGSSVNMTASNSAAVAARGIKDLKQFAHIVHCLKSIVIQKTVDSTTTGTTQTSTLPQSTTTATVSTTSTSMMFPRFGHGNTVYTTAYTTVTVGYNVQSLTTVTAQVTSTVKAYAACQTNNMLSPVASISGKTKYKTTVVASAQQCCEQCQQSSNCVGSAYQGLLPIGGRCLIYYADTCSAQSANSLQYSIPVSKFSFGSFVLSNGACGHFSAQAGAGAGAGVGVGASLHGHGFGHF